MSPEDETGPVDDSGPANDSPFGSSESRPGSSGAPGGGSPAGVKRGLTGWWRRRGAKDTAPATSERKPTKTRRSHGRRVSAVGDLEDVFIGAGPVIGRMFNLPATGRVISMHATVDAVMADEALAGTAVDRYAVQPVVRNRKRFDALLAIVETPYIMSRIEADPTDENIERWSASLYRAVRRSLPVMGPALIKVKKREEAIETAARELYGAELGIPEHDEMGNPVDPVAWIVRDFLRPLYDARAQEQSSNGARAVAPVTAEANASG